ncbi:MAG: hypothetical protein H0X38_02460 [Planctomycetes bacterium]|nr:hypothetical protein [Planctomycetota bacterium]
MTFTIRGGGDLQYALAHLDRLKHLVELDRAELEVASLRDDLRVQIVARIARNQARVDEIAATVRAFRGW